MKKKKKKSGATRRCGRWLEIEAVKLPENIFGATILEKMSSISVFELFFTLVAVVYREETNEMKASLETH